MSAAGGRRPRIRLRPTAALGYLAFALVCIYGGAVHYQSNAAYLVLALGTACALVSGLHAWRNLEGLALAAGALPPALSGDGLLGALTLTAGAQAAASLAIQLPEAGSAAVARVDLVGANASVELPFALPPRARGEYRLTRVRIATTYPLGLFCAWVELALPLCWLVYPRPLGEDAGEPPEEQPAEASTREVSGAGDFLGHRSWEMGETQRRVDWRAVARGGPLLVKQYGGGIEASRALRWEEAGPGEVEERLARLAGRVLAAERSGAAYALSLPDVDLAAANGPAHFHRCMGALARFPGLAVGALAADPDHTRLRWLIAAMAMSTLPFAIDLPPWEVLGVAGCAWVRVVRERSGRGAVPRLVRMAIMVLMLVALWFSGALGVGLALGTPMVVGFCWLKLLEMKDERDYTLCCFLSLFLVAVQLFDQQSLLSCAWSLAAMVVILGALNRYQVEGAAASAAAVRAGTRRLLLHAAPLALLVFVLTPRLQLDLPNVTGQGVSGFTDRMRPGDIARMATSDKVVFRVEFPDGQLPNGIELYWRGLVMNASADGALWRVEDAYSGATRPKSPWPGGAQLPTLTQDITLMPDGQRWLFALESPLPLPLADGAGYRADNATLRHGQPVNRVLSYRVTSRLGDRAMDNDPAASVTYRGPRLSEIAGLAAQLKAGSADADQAAAAVIRYFREQGFAYSLNPGAMGEDSLYQFLFVAKVGFCAHYATAFASLMRLMGYPARVVIGYHGGEVNPVGDFVVVRQLHAHAWAEVRQKDGDWKHYDPTSGLPVAPGEELSIAQRPGAAALSMTLDRTPAWLPGWLRAPWQATSQWLGWAEARWDGWFMGFDGDRQALLMAALGLGRLGPLGLFALLVLCGVVLLLALRRALRRRPQPADQVAGPYQRWCRRLARRGLERPAWEGPLDFAERAAAAWPAHAAELREAGALYARLRFHPGGDRRAELRRFLALTARLPRGAPRAAGSGAPAASAAAAGGPPARGSGG